MKGGDLYVSGLKIPCFINQNLNVKKGNNMKFKLAVLSLLMLVIICIFAIADSSPPDVITAQQFEIDYDISQLPAAIPSFDHMPEFWACNSCVIEHLSADNETRYEAHNGMTEYALVKHNPANLRVIIDKSPIDSQKVRTLENQNIWIASSATEFTADLRVFNDRTVI